MKQHYIIMSSSYTNGTRIAMHITDESKLNLERVHIKYWYKAYENKWKTDWKDKKTHASWEENSKNIKSTVHECAIIMVENGCKWRALPKEFGNWHTIYMRFSRWTKNGTIQRIFDAQSEVFAWTALPSKSILILLEPEKKWWAKRIGCSKGG